MLKIDSYLLFNGKCREAMEFYKSVFGGDLQMQTFGETPSDQPAAEPDWIMHARLEKGSLVLMASDSQPGHFVQNGTSISLSVNCTSLEEIENYFSGISEGASITMPLMETFWAARFGMLTDKFGVPWMFNLDKPQA